jgi:hypothetical protein
MRFLAKSPYQPVFDVRMPGTGDGFIEELDDFSAVTGNVHEAGRPGCEKN